MWRWRQNPSVATGGRWTSRSLAAAVTATATAASALTGPLQPMSMHRLLPRIRHVPFNNIKLPQCPHACIHTVAARRTDANGQVNVPSTSSSSSRPSAAQSNSVADRYGQTNQGVDDYADVLDHDGSRSRNNIESTHSSVSSRSIDSVSSATLTNQPNFHAPDGRTQSDIAASLEIVNAFAFEQKSASSSKQQSEGESSEEQLSTILTQLSTPFQPSSHLTPIIVSLLKSDLHSYAFLKMAARASLAPPGSGRSWKVVPEWDYDDELRIAPTQNSPTFQTQQKAMRKGIVIDSENPNNDDHTSSSNENPSNQPAHDPYTVDQIRSNLDAFIHSNHFNECSPLYEIIQRTQQQYLSLVESIVSVIKEFQQYEQKHFLQPLPSNDDPAGRRRLQETKALKKKLRAATRKWKKRLSEAWKMREEEILVTLVNQFIVFMEEPMDPLTQSLNDAVASSNGSLPSRASSSISSSLPKTRGGRLLFDPSLVDLSNLSSPHTWYPLARSIPRKFIVHVGPTNSGKCWATGTKMMLLDGSVKNVEDIVEGEALMGDDSQPRIVQHGSLFSGRSMLYEIRPTKGSGRKSWRCNEDHILVLRWENEPTYPVYDASADPNNPWMIERLKVVDREVMTEVRRFHSELAATDAFDRMVQNTYPLIHECSVLDYLALPKSIRDRATMFQPALTNFPPAADPKQTLHARMEATWGKQVDEHQADETAWVLGWWIGFGGVDTNDHAYLNISTGIRHAAILNRLQRWVDGLSSDFASTAIPIASHADFTLTRLPPAFTSLLATYNLDAFMQDGSLQLPLSLLTESASIRSNLLAGLIDGSTLSTHSLPPSTRSSSFPITFPSDRSSLIDSFKHLCRGLGIVPVSDETFELDSTIQLNLSVDTLHSIPALITSHLEITPSPTPSPDTVNGDLPKKVKSFSPSHCFSFTIEAVGEGAWHGFTVSGDGRVLLEDFVVSHNTYHALNRLMEAESGVYAGPLRLLAWEVYDKLCKKGVPCDLLTGQEVQRTIGAKHTSSTVEMVNVETIVDVAVIDEVQLLASPDRGDAWTRAILGLAAYEIHVCGDPSMVELVEELCAVTGEEVEIREYERLTPLEVAPPLQRGLKEVRAGDCIVAFSRKQLYAIRHEIEQTLGLKCCIIYGSLPPETRRQQAELFNDPSSGYDVLVASDAIGMGLNLNIGRVIFAKMEKFDGETNRPLTPSETRQIAGRAGRFNTNNRALATKDNNGSNNTPATLATTMEEAAKTNIGYATTLNPDEHAYLQWALAQTLAPLERAGLMPTYDQLELLHSLRPKETLANLLHYFTHYAKLDTLYFPIHMDSYKQIAELLEKVPFTSLKQRFMFCQAPVKLRSPIVNGALITFAKLVATSQAIPLKAFKIPTVQLPRTQTSFMLMETLYAVLDLYIWLAIKFGEQLFVDLERAQRLREQTARIIATGLERLSPPPRILQRLRRKASQHISASDSSSSSSSNIVSKHAPVHSADRTLQSYRDRNKEYHRKRHSHSVPTSTSAGQRHTQRQQNEDESRRGSRRPHRPRPSTASSSQASS